MTNETFLLNTKYCSIKKSSVEEMRESIVVIEDNAIALFYVQRTT